jgi:2-amino-4-hydroxy-6-hydroxymethyldihydropteridine diphosphokinase
LYYTQSGKIKQRKSDISYNISMMRKGFVSLGANLGKPREQVLEAIERIKSSQDIFNLIASPLYQTNPISHYSQPNFINGVIAFDTPLSSDALLSLLQSIETSLGKVPKPKWAPRAIDLDLLFLGDEKQKSETLTLPHPEWQNRLFVLKPLSDLFPELNLFGKTYNLLEMVEQLQTQQAIL